MGQVGLRRTGLPKGGHPSCFYLPASCPPTQSGNPLVYRQLLVGPGVERANLSVRDSGVPRY